MGGMKNCVPIIVHFLATNTCNIFLSKKIFCMTLVVEKNQIPIRDKSSELHAYLTLANFKTKNVSCTFYSAKKVTCCDFGDKNVFDHIDKNHISNMIFTKKTFRCLISFLCQKTIGNKVLFLNHHLIMVRILVKIQCLAHFI